MFWSLTLILMLMLGCYWCFTAYQSWKEQPVLTTITTAGLPVEQVIRAIQITLEKYDSRHFVFALLSGKHLGIYFT